MNNAPGPEWRTDLLTKRIEALETLIETIIGNRENAQEAILAIQRKVGINDSKDPNSIDYRVAQLENTVGTPATCPTCGKSTKYEMPTDSSAWRHGDICADPFHRAIPVQPVHEDALYAEQEAQLKRITRPPATPSTEKDQ